MSKRAAIILAILILVVSVSAWHAAPVAHRSTSFRIEEDNPAWNCHTMGNHICGHS